MQSQSDPSDQTQNLIYYSDAVFLLHFLLKSALWSTTNTIQPNGNPQHSRLTPKKERPQQIILLIKHHMKI